MASRSTLRTWLLDYLGTSSDDPAYSATRLNPILQQAVDSLTTDIQEQNRGFFSTSLTLAANSATSHTYNLFTQAATFAYWLEVRYTNEDGALLKECRLEDLRSAGSDYFAIVGVEGQSDNALITSPDSPAGTALFFRYGYWPAEMDEDADIPQIPVRFHDVIPLEALFVFALGGEAQRPADLRERWMQRRGQLMSRAGKRGVTPSRTRLVDQDDTF